MYGISMTYRNMPVEIRERVALSQEGVCAFLERMRDRLSGCVVLATCNRFEIYLTGEGELWTVAEEGLAETAGVPLSFIRTYEMRYGEKNSIRHLCKVACGMDSMVLGEVEIIGQIRAAYQCSCRMQMANREIHLAFQGALAAAKAAASQGDATKLPISVGTVSAREAVDFCKKHAEGGGCVLVVGATGHMGSIVAKDIADMTPQIRVIGTSRTHAPHRALFPETPGILAGAYAQRYTLAAEADVIVSATTSPHYTFVAQKLAQQFLDAPRDRLFLDLAVPRDIDPQIASAPGCTLRDIDDMQTIAAQNNQSRKRSLQEMEPFVEAQADKIRKDILFSEFCQKNAKLMTRLRETDGAGVIYRMKTQMGCDAFQEMLDGLFSIYDRIES